MCMETCLPLILQTERSEMGRIFSLRDFRRRQEPGSLHREVNNVFRNFPWIELY